MLIIFAFSSLTPGTLGEASSHVQGSSSLVGTATGHMVEYAVLAFLAYRLVLSYGVSAAPLSWACVLLVVAAYGATDELHQSFVPGRDASPLDIGYDAIGGVFGLLAVGVVSRSWSYLRERRYEQGPHAR